MDKNWKVSECTLTNKNLHYIEENSGKQDDQRESYLDPIKQGALNVHLNVQVRMYKYGCSYRLGAGS